MSDKTEIDYDKLAKKIVEHTLPMHPDSLWTPEQIGQYLQKSRCHVYQEVLTQSTFPQGYKSTEKSRCIVWRAGDVIAWATRREGRPRKSA